MWFMVLVSYCRLAKGETDMRRKRTWFAATGLLLCVVVAANGQETKKKTQPTGAEEASKKKTSNLPVQAKESFADVMKRMKAEKPAVTEKHKKLLAERYDLSDRPAKGVEDVARQAGAGRRAREAAARHDLGRARRR